MKLVLAIAVALTLSASAQEKAVLITPIAAPPEVTEIEISAIVIQRLPDWQLLIQWKSSDGVYSHDSHVGVFHGVTNPNGADVLVKALNKANLGAKSLECRALEHLRDEGKIPTFTSCTGTPQ